MPIAPIVRRETSEHEVGTRLKRKVVVSRPAEGDLQNGSGRRGRYISVRSCACSFPQREYRVRKAKSVPSPKTPGILAPHTSTRGCGKHEADCRPGSPDCAYINGRNLNSPPRTEEWEVETPGGECGHRLRLCPGLLRAIHASPRCSSSRCSTLRCHLRWCSIRHHGPRYNAAPRRGILLRSDVRYCGDGGQTHHAPAFRTLAIERVELVLDHLKEIICFPVPGQHARIICLAGIRNIDKFLTASHVDRPRLVIDDPGCVIEASGLRHQVIGSDRVARAAT